MTAWAVERPLDPTMTGGGATAGLAVTPARYCPGRVPGGTVTVNGISVDCPGPSLRVVGRPLTQHPVPTQGLNDP